jgi:hypothetical protein
MNINDKHLRKGGKMKKFTLIPFLALCFNVVFPLGAIQIEPATAQASALGASRMIRGRTKASEATLRSAKITFSLPDGDDKDDNTKVSVTVTTKAGPEFEMRIASLAGFGDQQVWEDDGNHSYSYDLKVGGGIKLSQVTAGGIKTKIEWAPVGNDRGFFNYRLVLRFDDDDPSTDPIELEQTNPALIEMSEKIRTYTNP